MTPVVTANRLLVSAFSSPGPAGPGGGSSVDRAQVFRVSGQERSDGFAVAQASPGGAAALTSTVDGAAVDVRSTGPSNGNGQGSAIGESVLKYMKALHEDGRRIQDKAPTAAEPAVKLVIAKEPGPASAALTPAGPQGAPPEPSFEQAFAADLAALEALQMNLVSVNLAASVVSSAAGTVKTLTERMG